MSDKNTPISIELKLSKKESESIRDYFHSHKKIDEKMVHTVLRRIGHTVWVGNFIGAKEETP